MRFVLILGLVLSLGGCSTVGGWIGGLWGSDVSDRALSYRAKLTRGADRRDFLVSVSAGGVSVDDVRESARFPATRYCLKTFGGSDIDWLTNPDTGDWSFARDGQNMIFSGHCLAR